MLPGHLEIGNRETEIIVAPKLRKSVEFGTVEEHQWNPPITTKGKEAKLYSVDEYYSQDRSSRVNCLWLSESILFVSLFWYSVLSFVLRPPWPLLLKARNQLVEIKTQNTSLFDTFDPFITPLSASSTFVFIVIGLIPLILIISSWNIGLRVTKDVTYRNCALHSFVMFICIAAIISNIHLLIVVNNFEEQSWMSQTQDLLNIHTQALLDKNMTVSETFVIKLEPFSTLPYFVCTFVTLTLSTICCIIIIAILTYFSIDKSDNHLLDKIHQCSENKLQFEINRLERKAKILPAKEKEVFLLPFVYSKDLPQNDGRGDSQNLSVEPKKT
uniref:Uncharacterized protein n=1 Tax=Panagrolaimus superbus TaxID=310955 RepID=A0A914YR44_9BILA